MREKYVMDFHEGSAEMKSLLGGKGANLAEMTRHGLPVPPGFTITTDACRRYYEEDGKLPEGLIDEVALAMKRLEGAKNQTFGGVESAPLLVSVRSGSVHSMPGMMDTILNLGLNDRTVEGLARSSGKPSFAYDCYRRFIQMFGEVVYGIENIYFEQLYHSMKSNTDTDSLDHLPQEDWQTLINQYKKAFASHAGRPFPQDVHEQLELAINAVFRSWNNSRAVVYRRAHRIPDDLGTAVNIQAMVFGNLGDDCGTGVVFTRNPSTGEKGLYGEYLINAQGEDVVAGIRTPLPVSELERSQPETYRQLLATCEQLEKHYRDMQDIEFTVENRKLYLLQTRNGKRTAQASVKIAVDLVHEGILSRTEALLRIETGHLDQLLHRAIDSSATLDVLAKGLPASPGAAAGVAVFDADKAEQWAKAGQKVILIRMETNPDDIHGVIAAEGVLTSRGGMTSHAAVVARGMGKPCVCGCEEIRIEQDAFSVGGQTVKEGDWLSIDGATGRVIRGTVPLTEPEMSAELLELLQWADDIRELKVYTNADNPADASKAREFGAEGIGLCRTEHMFMSAERSPVVQAMILAETAEERAAALQRLLPMQQSDFEGLYRAMSGLPVTIRLLDPPLHEFLPDLEQLQERLSSLDSAFSTGNNEDNRYGEEREELERLIRKVKRLHEANPMLGQRGCRLGIVLPEIYEMQVQAIFQAAITCCSEGIRVIPEIMIPLVGHPRELEILKEMVHREAKRLLAAAGQELPYKVGTMIEVPRAALLSDQIASHADFFSYGTNDLTQMTYGYSRDDAEGKFLAYYVENRILPENPFEVLDTEGVGQLIEMSVNKGRSVKPDLKAGICGEHGGEKNSIFFCHSAGLDYVSCSPYRVPIARLAAAQAAAASKTVAYSG
ncbi:pyruvate, phosphate dikinase [Paenibacillus senegalensis]|uniref:pyruvate, phosphate dikinase n=1 Tax=Paenibacillus senegalensis TaxID=1465766 RepID=UPI000288EABC|nr:pyruvate, phosphate dikinase [Paenibacillus senegalensis]